MTDPAAQPFLRMLLAALQNLAAPAAVQQEHLRDSGTAPSSDELALEFDDAFVPLDHRLEPLGFEPEAADSVREVSRLLERMSGERNAHLWTTTALEAAEEWAEVRRSAGLAIGLWPAGAAARRRGSASSDRSGSSKPPGDPDR